MSAFVRERLVVGSEYTVSIDAVRLAWLKWAEDNGDRPGTAQLLGRNLRAVVLRLQVVRIGGRDDQVRTNLGLGLGGHREGQ